MSAFVLKIIAIIAMLLNHIGHVFGGNMTDGLYYLFMTPGGLTFPIMAFLMSEGYRYTRSFKKYAQNLLIFAVITCIPYFLVLGYQLNILFTLYFGLLIIHAYNTMKSRTDFWILFVCATLLSIFCDWGLVGIPMILCYHIIKNKWLKVIIPVAIVWLVLGSMTIAFYEGREMIAQLLYICVGCTSTIPLLLSYNGQRGPGMKYFFYAFYPVHIIVLGVVSYLF